MIDTSALKTKVLALAFQGQLTEQTNENAYELYVHVCEKRDLLIKEKSIKKNKTKSITNDDIKYEIPSNWVWVRLGDVINLQSGQDLATSDYNDKVLGVPYITGASNFKTDESLIINRWTEKPKAIALEDDILLSVKGTVGKLAFLHEEKVHIARQIMGIRPIGLNRKYVKYFVQEQVEELKAISKGLIPGIERDNVLNMLMPMPPLCEQEIIVEKIEEAFKQLDIIDVMQLQYLSDLEVLKSKIIDAGIQGKLTEKLPEDGTAEELYSLMIEEKKQILKERKGSDDKNIKDVDIDVPYELPDNWKWVRFGEIGLFRKGPFGSALTKAMFVPKSDDTVKVYEQQHAIQKNSELGTYYITREYFDDKMRGFEVLPGDILVSCAGTIGETYILPDEIEQGIINQALMRVSLVPSVNKRFFQYYFDANLKKTAQEESNGSAIKNIPPFDVMKNWYFPLAPLKEQERIIEKIEELLALI